MTKYIHNILPEYRFLLLLVAFIFLASSVPAQNMPDTSQGRMTKGLSIEEVVVTGQYAPNNPEKAVQKIKIIDRAKIDAMSAQNLRDVLTNEMSVRLSQDNILGSGVSIQGIGGENVKILIDGVPVIGRQDGNIDLSQINLYNTERIEIVEGPMSVNYGSDALAGTINIITRKSQKDFCTVGLSTYYESIGTYNANARIGFHRKKHTFIATGGRNFFQGWSSGKSISLFDFGEKPADSSRFQQWKPKLQQMAGVQYIFNTGKTNFNYKGDYFNELITNRGLPGIYGEKALDDYYRTKRIDNAVFMNTRLGEDQNLNVFVAYNAFTRIKNTYVKDLTTLAENLTQSDGDQDTSKYSLIASRGSYATSRKAAKLNYELGYDINVETAKGVRLKGQTREIGDYAAFASAEYKPVSNLTIRPGLRYAYNTDYQAPLVPSVNVRYKVNDFTFRASFAQGFRAPSLKELYFDFHDSNHDIDGNPNLKAEYSNSYNASVLYSRQKDNLYYKLDASVFYNDIRDRIELAQIQGQGAYYTYVNIGRYKTLGTQVNATIRYEKLSTLLGWSYIGRYNNLFGTEKGVSEFSYAPEVRVNVSYVFPADIVANLFYKYTGKLPGFGYNSAGEVITTRIADYHMADLTFSKTFWDKKLTLSLGSKNLFNVQNLNITGTVATGAAHATTGNSPVSTGRSYFLKADININSRN